jgi:UPF0755 protein
VNNNQPIRLPDTDMRRPRRSAVLRVLGWLVGLGVLAAIAAAVTGSWLYANYTAPGPLAEAVIVDVPKSLDRMQIAQLLHDKGVVSEPMTMGVAAIAQGLRGASMKAGEYEFPAGSSMADVFNIMASGRVVTYKLTVPEGWTSEMAVNRMREQEPMAGEISAVPPEGAVIANTYLYARGKDRQQLLDEMVAAQTKLVDEVWSRRPADSIIKTKEELVTLASIVEKETAKPEERPRVAAVFLNRLKAGMRLQSDPTIIYGIAGGKGKLDRAISQSDIDTETPYNTYRINGLPPGPIATPGKDALEAVIAPAAVNDLYFVADGTGGHVFAATLEEHNANVKKWRAIEAGQTPPPQPETAAAPADGSAPVAAPETAAAPAQPATQAALPNVAEEEALNATANQKAADPVPAPAEEAEAAAAPAAATTLKPGSLVKVGNTLVPIPALKKSKP